MGVERSHQAHATAQRHTAGKAPGQPGQAAASGDFLSLMAALEDGLAALDGDGLAALPGDAPAAGGKRGRADADADAALVDPATLGAAGAVGALVLPVPAPLPGAAATGADAVLRKAGHLAVEAAVPTAADAAAAAGPAPTGATSADPRLAPEYASVFEQLQKYLAAREASVPESALRSTATAATAANAALAPQASATAALQMREGRDLKAESGVAALSSTAARTESVTVAALQDLAVTGADKARSGGQETSGGSHQGSAHGGWAAADFTPTVQYDATLGGLDVSATLQPDSTFDRQLADQLRHWVSNGVRSAELTVGTSEPVQVRIALDGNEAQVQFRAEHAATRDMLAGTVDQLRDLLGAEGLVLSGMSVGGHDAGGARGQGEGGGADRATSQRQAAAQAEPVGEVVAATPRRGAGVLDLYV